MLINSHGGSGSKSVGVRKNKNRGTRKSGQSTTLPTRNRSGAADTKKIVRRVVRKKRRRPHTNTEVDNMHAVMRHRSGNYGSQSGETQAKKGLVTRVSDRVSHVNDGLKVVKNGAEAARQVGEAAADKSRVARKVGGVAETVGDVQKTVGKKVKPFSKTRGTIKAVAKLADGTEGVSGRAVAAGKAVSNGLDALDSVGVKKRVLDPVNSAKGKVAPHLDEAVSGAGEVTKTVAKASPKAAKVAGKAAPAVKFASKRVPGIGTAVGFADGANKIVNGKTEEEKLVGKAEVASSTLAAGAVAAAVVFPPAAVPLGVASLALAGGAVVYENREGIAQTAKGIANWATGKS